MTATRSTMSSISRAALRKPATGSLGVKRVMPPASTLPSANPRTSFARSSGDRSSPSTFGSVRIAKVNSP